MSRIARAALLSVLTLAACTDSGDGTGQSAVNDGYAWYAGI
jgi:hypothetical protein